MTHSWATFLYFIPTWLLDRGMNFAASGPHQVTGLFISKNYLTMEIEWSEGGEQESLDFHLRGEQGESLFHLNTPFDALRLQMNVINDEIPDNCFMEKDRATQPPPFSLSGLQYVVASLSITVVALYFVGAFS